MTALVTATVSTVSAEVAPPPAAAPAVSQPTLLASTNRRREQRLPLQQSLMGEAIVRRAVAAGLKAPQDGGGIGGRTDTQQPEMIDGQIQRPEVA